jgi:predicted deacylase
VILCFLRHAGATQSAPEVRFQTRAVRGHHLSTPASGLLCLHIELGEGVRAGQRLAAVLNLAGQTLAEVVAPAAGEIGAVRRFVPARAGDHAVTVFEPISAETLLNS